MSDQPFEYIFRTAYKDTYNENCPKSINILKYHDDIEELKNHINKLNEKSVNISEIEDELKHKFGINTIAGDYTDTKSLQTQISELILSKFQNLTKICSLMISILRSIGKDYDQFTKLYHSSQEIVKSINLEYKSELTIFDTSNKMDEWIENSVELAEKAKKSVDYTLYQEKPTCHICPFCKKHPSITYAYPCHHSGLCSECYQKRLSEPQLFYTNCAYCKKIVTELHPFKDPKIKY